MRDERFWEIDFFRGIAIVMMIIFHTFFFINYFNLASFSMYQGFWLSFRLILIFLFLSIAGISLVISAKKRNLFQQIKRGFEIFLLGMSITIVTGIFFYDNIVIFGILHLIGISIIIGALFIRFKWTSLIFGLILFFANFFVTKTILSFPWLIWLGFKFSGFSSFDYYPLIPWMGLVLIGIFIGDILYANGKRNKLLNFMPKKAPCSAKLISLLGRHSLLIYFIHILLLFGLIWLIQFIIV